MEEIKSNLYWKHYVVFSLFIIFHLVLIITLCLHLYRQRYKKKPSNYFLKISQKISYILDILYWRPLEYVHNLIAPHIPGSGSLFHYLEYNWTKNEYNYKYFYSLVFLFDILPKLLLTCMFFIDIVVLSQVKYFLYCLPLFFIPIGFSIFLKLMLTFSKNNMPIIKEYFSEIKGINPYYNDNKEITGYARYEWIVKPEYESVIDEQKEIELLLQLQSMQQYALHIKSEMDKIAPYVTLISSLLYVTSGIYRLLIIIL